MGGCCRRENCIFGKGRRKHGGFVEGDCIFADSGTEGRHVHRYGDSVHRVMGFSVSGGVLPFFDFRIQVFSCSDVGFLVACVCRGSIPDPRVQCVLVDPNVNRSGCSCLLPKSKWITEENRNCRS